MSNDFLNDTPINLPAGIYESRWTAYYMNIETENDTVVAKTNVGVRGINIPTIIEVDENGFFRVVKSSDGDLGEIKQKTPTMQASAIKQKFSKTFELSISELTTRKELFQGRQEDFSQATYDKIMREGFDKSQEPIVVWHDKAKNEYVVISGHSRLAAATTLYNAGQDNLATLNVKEFIGDLDDAVSYAILDSNRSGTAEGLISDILAYKKATTTGCNKECLRGYFKTDSYVSSLQKLAYLNIEGDMLRNLNEPSQAKLFPKLQQYAEWTGELRKNYERITNNHENEIFKFLFGVTKNILDRNEFFNLIEKVVAKFDFNPAYPLNLIKFKSKSNLALQSESNIQSLEKEIRDFEQRRNENDNTIILLREKEASEKRDTKILELKSENSRINNKILDLKEKLYKIKDNIKQGERSQFDIFSNANIEYTPKVEQPAPAQSDTQMLVETLQLLMLGADAQEEQELNELIEVLYLLDEDGLNGFLGAVKEKIPKITKFENFADFVKKLRGFIKDAFGNDYYIKTSEGMFGKQVTISLKDRYTQFPKDFISAFSFIDFTYKSSEFFLTGIDVNKFLPIYNAYYQNANIEYAPKVVAPAPKKTDTQMLVETLQLLMLGADAQEEQELNELIEVLYLLDEDSLNGLGVVNKTIIQRKLPLNTSYTLIEKKYISIIDGGHTCDNCGRLIANIATVKNEQGKSFNIGFDCLETFLINNNLLSKGDILEYEKSKQEISKILRLSKAIKTQIEENKGTKWEVTQIQIKHPNNIMFWGKYIEYTLGNQYSRKEYTAKIKDVDHDFAVKTLKSIFGSLEVNALSFDKNGYNDDGFLAKMKNRQPAQPAQTDTQMLVETLQLLMLGADAQEEQELQELIEVLYLLDEA